MAPPSRPIEILHVDDDPMVLEFVEEFIKPNYPEMKFTTLESPQAALELLLTRSFDCVISDYKMTEMDGLTFAAKVRVLSDVPIILYTGQGSEEVAEKAFAVGIDDYIKKEINPAHYQVLAKRIVSVVEKRRVEARNYELERSTREKLEALHRHATSLVNLTALDEVARCSFDIIEEVMGFTIGAFLVVQGVDLVSIGNRGSSSLGRLISINGKGVTAKAAREQRSVLVKDVRGDPDYVRGTLDSMSELAVPVILGKEVVAVINFESLELGAFDETDQKLLEILSEHIASTIQRIRLLESVRRYTANLETLQRHAATLANIDTVEGVAKYSFDIIEKLLGFSEGAFGVVEEEYLKFIYAGTISVEKLPLMPLNGRGIKIRAVKTGEPQLVPDVRLDPDFVRIDELSDLLSELDVPVKVDGRVVAVINLEKDSLDAFSDEDRRIIEVLSEQVASAISRIEQLRVIKASGETYQKLLDSSLESVLLISGTKILYSNRNIAKLLGYDDVSELIGQDMAVTISDDERERIMQRTLSRQRGEPQPDRYELKLIRKDGKVVDVEVAVSLTEYEGKPAVLSFARDMTERKRFERQLKALHDSAATLQRATNLGEVCESTLDVIESVIGFHMASVLIASGGELESIVSRGQPTFGRRIPIDGRGITAKAARERRSVLVNDLRNDPDFLRGTIDSMSELAVPVILDGRVIAVLNVENVELNAFDESNHKLLETLAIHVASAMSRIDQLNIIKESEEKYKSLLDSSREAIFVDSDSKIVYINQNAIGLLGYGEAGELIGRDVSLVLADGQEPSLMGRALSWQRGDVQPTECTLKLTRRDGEKVDVEASVSPIDYEGSNALIVFARDISDRKRYQMKLIRLHESAKRLSGASTRDEIWDTTIETVTQILGFDFAGIGVVEGNTVKFVRSVGSELPMDWSLDLSKPSVISRTIEMGVPQLVRDTSLDPDYYCGPGFESRSSELAIPIMVDGHPVAVLNIKGDRTSMFGEADVSLLQILVGQVASAIDRIAHQEEEINRRETRQRELLEGMERMSGMVRHDLRGPLQTIQSASYMIRRRPDRAEELTRKIDEGVDYAVRILDDLKTMTKDEVLNRVSTNLRDLVEKSIDSASIPANVRVDKNLAPVSVEVDQYRIRRVVDNLVKNAVEAMPDGGTLTLRVENVDGMATLTVRDTDTGISDEVARNLFTLFYTTKTGGTGLGLVICRQVFEAHGGRITFDSIVGEGTTFTVDLPLTARVPPARAMGTNVFFGLQSTLKNIRGGKNGGEAEGAPDSH